MDGGMRSAWNFLGAEAVANASVKELQEEEEMAVAEDMEDLLFFLEPPPTGTFLSDPPSVQYLLQVLQKYLGWVRL